MYRGGRKVSIVFLDNYEKWLRKYFLYIFQG
jgi:hypothetical protein